VVAAAVAGAEDAEVVAGGDAGAGATVGAAGMGAVDDGTAPGMALVGNAEDAVGTAVAGVFIAPPSPDNGSICAMAQAPCIMHNKAKARSGESVMFSPPLDKQSFQEIRARRGMQEEFVKSSRHTPCAVANISRLQEANGTWNVPATLLPGERVHRSTYTLPSPSASSYRTCCTFARPAPAPAQEHALLPHTRF
jgi:hypothetical protein